MLAEYGIESGRKPEYTGVWVGESKIAAIGIRVSRWVTMHGFAFNINTDLELFDGIIPCGIKDKEVTSLSRLLKREINIDEVKQKLRDQFVLHFDYSTLKEIKIDQLRESQEVAQLGTWILDFKTGKTTHTNEFYKILEREEKDFNIPVGEQLLYFHPEDRALVTEAFMNVIQAQKGYQFEARLLIPNGRVKNILSVGRCSGD